MSTNRTGDEVAVFAKRHLPDAIRGSLAFKAKNYKQALISGFLSIDKELDNKKGRSEIQALFVSSPKKCAIPIDQQPETEELAHFIGCTACVTLITMGEIYVANVGDSRCVLCKRGQAVDMSEDHKPGLEQEKKRIEKANGYVEENRVNGKLNLSRCLGDLDYKQNKKLKQDEQIISALPEVRVEKITNEAEFLIIACDGVWDCLSSQAAVDYIKENVSTAKRVPTFRLSTALEKMLDSILAKDVEKSDGIGCDNMSCVLVMFDRAK